MRLRIYIILLLLCCFALPETATAAKWQSGTVIPKEGDSFKGEVKIGKRKFSTFIKYRDDNKNKRILRPEYIEKVITEDNAYQAIWFDKEVAGYNLWCFGKIITEGCVSIYDVYYPFKNCSCKTSGTYKNNWVIKFRDQPLFILEHSFISEEIKNTEELMDFLGEKNDLRDAMYGQTLTRPLIRALTEHFNANCNPGNRTYQISGDNEADFGKQEF